MGRKENGRDIGRCRIWLAALAGALAWLFVPAAHAATFSVLNSNDTGAGSLRQALTSANANGTGLDTLTFTTGSSGTIELQSELPQIASSLNVQGPGASALTVRRDTGGNYRILTIGNGGHTVSISGLTLANGAMLAQPGGGLLNQASTTTLDRVAVKGSISPHGGGIANQGTMTLRAVTVSANVAGQGGGIHNTGSLALLASTVTDNDADEGGALFNVATARIEGSTIAANTATETGGSNLSNEITGTTTLRSSIVTDPLGVASNCGADGDFVSAGYNLLGDATCGFVSGDQIGSDPQLGPLQDNGGPTKTMAIPATSPAVDRGTSALIGGGSATMDQRGKPRPVDFPLIENNNGVNADGADVGAFEREGVSKLLRVTNVNDAGTGSLRAAIAAANDALNPVTIRFTGTALGTIELQSALPVLTNDISIRGLGASRTVLRREANENFGILALDGNFESTISRLTLANGEGAVGGFANQGGKVTLDRVAVRGNAGTYAGVLNDGEMTILGSTVSGNTGVDAGAVGSFGPLTVRNSTITANSAPDGIGGVDIDWPATVEGSTLVDNLPRNIAAGATVQLAGSIVFDSNENPSCAGSGSLISNGYNLASDGSCNLNGTGDQPFSDPMIGPLQDNGGLIRTMALAPGSPAIDAGSGPGNVDGRGLRRRVDFLAVQNPLGGTAGDIGAYEVQGQRCNDQAASIVAAPGEVVTGTSGADVISGTSGQDEIHAGTGNDTVCGFAENDQVFGDGGEDTLFGGARHDTLNGGTETDACHGEDGNDSATLCESVTGVP